MSENRYRPSEVEGKWQRRWEERGLFRAPDVPGPDKYYALEMFPYPSGRLHMGHVRNYAIGDAVARFHAMRGRTVLHPMGWDAFGLPAEQAAVERKLDPKEWTFANIAEMRRQLRLLGLTYDWDREVTTCLPDYYRWEQLVFVRMFERGLAYRKRSFVNWSEALQTVLANEQVIDGRDYKLGEPVIQKELDQWFLRTTAYAQRLLDGIAELEGKWSERVLLEQRARIGRSEGAEIVFPLASECGGETAITVFTTRPDTLFGVTFMSLAAEHPLALELARGTPREAEVRAFVERVRNEDKRKRTAEDYVKEGCPTGAACTNPATGERIPIFIANFVVTDYGTGAVMAVPAHDQRDFEFARKYGLPIRVVIRPPDGSELDPATMAQAFTDEGIQVNSGPFDGIPSPEGIRRIPPWLQERGQGGPAVSWRLRDWCVSRQRYWGCPIPMLTCERCGVQPVPESDLPVVLPADVEFRADGGSPLARHPSFTKARCPKCGGDARRETDTLDTFVESSWYFLRYLDPKWDGGVVRPDRVAWMPVDQYIGGVEHAVGHLMYARFWHKVLKDLGFLPSSAPEEPFARLLTQGMVCKETYFQPDEHGNPVWHYPEEVRDGKSTINGRPVETGRVEKMSKSKRNVVGLEDFVEQYGADTARIFTLFAAPPEKGLEWRAEGVEGCWRFVNRVWRLVRENAPGVAAAKGAPVPADLPPEWTALRRTIHQTIRRVTHDVDGRFHFNTAIAAIMELTNAMAGAPAADDADPPGVRAVRREGLSTIVRLLSPFAPHLCDELWEALGEEGTTLEAGWPSFDPAVAADEAITVPVQVNGKLRGQVQVPTGTDEATVLDAARAEPNVARHLEGKKPVRTVYVPGRLVNFVVK